MGQDYLDRLGERSEYSPVTAARLAGVRHLPNDALCFSVKAQPFALKLSQLIDLDPRTCCAYHAHADKH